MLSSKVKKSKKKKEKCYVVVYKINVYKYILYMMSNSKKININKK